MQKLSKKDLKIGMTVTTTQLDDIYGMWIHLADYDKIKGGKIIYFTDDENDMNAYEFTKDYVGRMSVFYQNPEYTNEEVAFYE